MPVEPFDLGGEPYAIEPSLVPVQLDISRMTHSGYALRLRFEVSVHGPCMRCLEPAHPKIAIDVRDVDQPGGGEELESPYITDQQLDLAAWVREALAVPLTLPKQVLCRPDCAGLCAVCGVDLNAAGPDHAHESEPDPRWAKLRELEL